MRPPRVRPCWMVQDAAALEFPARPLRSALDGRLQWRRASRPTSKFWPPGSVDERQPSRSSKRAQLLADRLDGVKAMHTFSPMSQPRGADLVPVPLHGTAPAQSLAAPLHILDCARAPVPGDGHESTANPHPVRTRKSNDLLGFLAARDGPGINAHRSHALAWDHQLRGLTRQHRGVLNAS